MKNLVKDTIHANGIDIGIYTQDFENEFISLTDIARYKSDEPKDVIKNWMRSKDTIEFLGLWEKLHNSNFIRRSNSTPLEIRQGLMHLQCHLQNG